MNFLISYDLREDIHMWYNSYTEQIYIENFRALVLNIKALHVKIYDHEVEVKEFVLEKFKL